ncbi:MAG: HAMP domain-containing protein, partial [Acidimicrobiales bacterium]|nr:HAMP domain-containing protein [Acidimicrobiales bacterium]
MKLVGALAVPLSALIIVTTLEVRNAAQEASAIRDQTALAGISLGPTSIMSAIEWERNAASVAMLGMEDAFSLPEEDPAKAAIETNGAIETFRAEVDRQDQAIVDAYAPAFEALDGLDELREVEAGTPAEDRGLGNIENVSAVFDDYTAIRDQLVEANRQVAMAIDDPVLRQGTDLVDLYSTQTNLVAILVRDLLIARVGGAADGVNTSQEIALVSRNLGHLRSNWTTMASTAAGPYRPAFDELLASDEAQRFPEVVDEAVQTGVVDVRALTTYAMSEDPETLAYTVFGNQVEDIVLDHARELDAAAQARQRWFMVLAVAAVIVAALAAWLVSRSITRPLRSLTREAKEMAERRLPDAVLTILETPLGDDVRIPSIAPVTTTTRDEVADVALALNTVQDTALDLAVEQALLRRNIADSFVNLGRRNQNLLGRQLDFITELESNETDPDSLANLFRLDHLATRMRRNAESLLVLAGIEPPRQWTAPVRITDVIRAALGEVEDYQRVT